MGFNDSSKKIYRAFSVKDSASRYYKSDDDVDNLRSIISDLIEAIDDIEYNFSYCEDEYEKVVLENNDLGQKMDALLHECNYMYPTAKLTVSLNLNNACELFLALPKDKSFLNEYGLEMIGTQMVGDPLEKEYIYNIINEKKWMLAKIKYGI